MHYLTFGPGMEQGAKLNKFYGALLLGEDQKKAFQEAFGNFKDVQEGLVRYTGQFLFSSYAAQSPPQLKEKDFPSRVTTLAETDAEFGAYRLFSHDRDEARASLEHALREDPNSALAHETLGFLDFADGNDQDAQRPMPPIRSNTYPCTTKRCFPRCVLPLLQPTNWPSVPQCTMS